MKLKNWKMEEDRKSLVPTVSFFFFFDDEEEEEGERESHK